MSRHEALMDDAAFQRAVRAARSCLDLYRDQPETDPDELARFLAMGTLSAFANADGLTEPHVGILARFAPDLGCDVPRPSTGL
jgi:hypothetical protein